MFTRKQLKKISEILRNYECECLADEGPYGEGEELTGLRDAVDTALRDREGWLPLPEGKGPIPVTFPFLSSDKGLL